MSKKNSLEAKRLRRENKQYDRGHTKYYTMVSDGKYTHTLSIMKATHKVHPKSLPFSIGSIMYSVCLNIFGLVDKSTPRKEWNYVV